MGDRTINGTYGLSRPDVRAAFPAAPDDFTGFEIRGRLGRGRQRGVLELQTLAGDWLAVTALEFTTPAWSAPLWMSRSARSDLVAFQLGTATAHRPRPPRCDRFPVVRHAAPAPIHVVTPSFNHGRYLGETVRSVLGQRGVWLRYSIQDGGSSDDSLALLQALDDARVSWRSEPDSGQADAIARGFRQTSGGPEDVMAWINSDDFYAPGALAYVAGYFARHPEVDVVYGHRILVDENSQEIGRWFLPPHDDEILRLNDFVPQETLFWRRRLWDKVGGIDTSFRFAMDWDLLLRFQVAGARIVRVPYFLACFRIHPAQKTSAQMEAIGQKEIDALRLRTFGRVIPPQEIETNPRLIRYLRKSAWIEFLWRRFRIRSR